MVAVKWLKPVKERKVVWVSFNRFYTFEPKYICNKESKQCHRFYVSRRLTNYFLGSKFQVSLSLLKSFWTRQHQIRFKFLVTFFKALNLKLKISVDNEFTSFGGNALIKLSILFVWSDLPEMHSWYPRIVPVVIFIYWFISLFLCFLVRKIKCYEFIRVHCNHLKSRTLKKYSHNLRLLGVICAILWHSFNSRNL